MQWNRLFCFVLFFYVFHQNTKLLERLGCSELLFLLEAVFLYLIICWVEKDRLSLQGDILATETMHQSENFFFLNYRKELVFNIRMWGKIPLFMTQIKLVDLRIFKACNMLYNGISSGSSLFGYLKSVGRRTKLLGGNIGAHFVYLESW